jgi:hypothetical protein
LIKTSYLPDSLFSERESSERERERERALSARHKLNANLSENYGRRRAL